MQVFAKKLVAAAAEKDNASIKPWISSIGNQLYWAATTSKQWRWQPLPNGVQSKTILLTFMCIMILTILYVYTSLWRIELG